MEQRGSSRIAGAAAGSAAIAAIYRGRVAAAGARLPDEAKTAAETVQRRGERRKVEANGRRMQVRSSRRKICIYIYVCMKEERNAN